MQIMIRILFLPFYRNLTYKKDIFYVQYLHG